MVCTCKTGRNKAVWFVWNSSATLNDPPPPCSPQAPTVPIPDPHLMSPTIGLTPVPQFRPSPARAARPCSPPTSEVYPLWVVYLSDLDPGDGAACR